MVLEPRLEQLDQDPHQLALAAIALRPERRETTQERRVHRAMLLEPRESAALHQQLVVLEVPRDLSEQLVDELREVFPLAARGVDVAEAADAGRQVPVLGGNAIRQSGQSRAGKIHAVYFVQK